MNFVMSTAILLAHQMSQLFCYLADFVNYAHGQSGVAFLDSTSSVQLGVYLCSCILVS